MIRILIISFLILLNSSAFSAEKKKPVGTPKKKETGAELISERKAVEDDIRDAYIDYLENGDVGSLYAVFVRGKTKIYEVNAGLDIKSPAGLASVTKHITSLILLKLSERGLLKISDPVDKYLPGVYSESQYVMNRKLTIRDLLTHKSGIPYEGPKSSFMYTLEEKEFNPPELNSVPGKKYQYSNYNYSLAGKIIEVLTDKPLWQNFRDEIFEPMEIEDYQFVNSFDGSTGLHIPPVYLFRIERMIENKGVWKGKRLLEKSSLKKLFLPPKKDKTGFYYGLGLHIFKKGKNVEAYHHNGVGDNLFTHMQILPLKNEIVFFHFTLPDMNIKVRNILSEKLVKLFYKLRILEEKIIKFRKKNRIKS